MSMPLETTLFVMVVFVVFGGIGLFQFYRRTLLLEELSKVGCALCDSTKVDLREDHTYSCHICGFDSAWIGVPELRPWVMRLDRLRHALAMIDGAIGTFQDSKAHLEDDGDDGTRDVGPDPALYASAFRDIVDARSSLQEEGPLDAGQLLACEVPEGTYEGNGWESNPSITVAVRLTRVMLKAGKRDLKVLGDDLLEFKRNLQARNA